MKHRVLTALFFTMIFLCSCGKEVDAPKEEEIQEIPIPTVEPTPEPVVEEYTIPDNVPKISDYSEDDYGYLYRDMHDYFYRDRLDSLSPYEQKILDEAIEALNLDPELIQEYCTEGWGDYVNNPEGAEYPCKIMLLYNGEQITYETTSMDNLFYIFSHQD